MSSGQPVVWMAEENYMFRLASFGPQLREWLNSGGILTSQLVTLCSTRGFVTISVYVVSPDSVTGFTDVIHSICPFFSYLIVHVHSVLSCFNIILLHEIDYFSFLISYLS